MKGPKFGAFKTSLKVLKPKGKWVIAALFPPFPIVVSAQNLCGDGKGELWLRLGYSLLYEYPSCTCQGNNCSCSYEGECSQPCEVCDGGCGLYDWECGAGCCSCSQSLPCSCGGEACDCYAEGMCTEPCSPCLCQSFPCEKCSYAGECGRQECAEETIIPCLCGLKGIPSMEGGGVVEHPSDT